MSTLRSEDRVSLCLFTYADGRRCRTPRISAHPHFCFVHARKEARARTTEKLSADLAYFFSGDYISACDLSTAISRIIPAVIRGDIKPKTASTVAYLAQTLIQAIHLTQREYVNAFGAEGWRKSVRQSVEMNSDFQTPPHAAAPNEPQPPSTVAATRPTPNQTPTTTSPATQLSKDSDRPLASISSCQSSESLQPAPNRILESVAPKFSANNESLQNGQSNCASSLEPTGAQQPPSAETPWVPRPSGFITTGRFRNRNRQHLQPL